MSHRSTSLDICCSTKGGQSYCCEGGGGRGISLASSFDPLLLKLSGYEALLPNHPTSFKSISCQFCSSFYTFSSSLYPLTFLLLLLLLLLLFHFLFLPFCCQFQRIFANFSPGAEEGGGDFLGLRGEGRGGGILDSLRPIPNERNFS